MAVAALSVDRIWNSLGRNCDQGQNSTRTKQAVSRGYGAPAYIFRQNEVAESPRSEARGYHKEIRRTHEITPLLAR